MVETATYNFLESRALQLREIADKNNAAKSEQQKKLEKA